MFDKHDIRIGREYENENDKGKIRKVVDKYTDYNENTDSSRRELVSYVVIGGGNSVKSCYMNQFLRWSNNK